MQVREVFNGNLNLSARFLSMYMEFVESLFYISQYETFKVLFRHSTRIGDRAHHPQ